MIKTTELMLGNLLFLTIIDDNTEEEKKVVVRIDTIYEDDVHFPLTCHRRSASPKELSGIPLTREIMNLLWSKFGSECSGELLVMNENGNELEIVVRGSEVSQAAYTDNGIYFINSILSIHQLQNLLTANGLPETAKEVGEKVMELLTANQKQPCRH